MPTITVLFPSDNLPVSVSVLTLLRQDTGDSIPGATGAMTESEAGSGVWSRAFDAPTSGLTYDLTVQAGFQNGDTQTETYEYADTTPTPDVSGHYIARSDLLAELGADELNKLSDLTGSMSEDDKLQVQQNAIDDAEAEFDMLLGTEGISVPTSLHERMVKLIVRKISAYRLYTHVGDALDDDVKGNNFKAKYDWARVQISEMLSNGAFSPDDENVSVTGVFTSIGISRRRSAQSDEFSRRTL